MADTSDKGCSRKFPSAGLERIAELEGLFVGQLYGDEIEAFYDCCRDGTATSAYEGASGFLGLPRVRVTDAGRAILAAHPIMEAEG